MPRAFPVAASIALAAALPAGWYAASPHYTIAAMQQAAVSADASALEAHVDFPALRQSLKSALTTRLAAQTRADASPLAAFGASLALSFVDPFVESAVSPEMLRLALAGAAEFAPQPEIQALALIASPRIEIERDGLNRFTASLEGAPANAPQAIFHRHGLGWKLTELRLPSEGAAERASS